MRNVVVIALLILLGKSIGAQVSLERSVISSFALNGNVGQLQIYSAGGQSIDTTIGSEPEYLAQGFEQPLDKSPLQVYYHVTLSLCNQQYTITIDSLEGCSQEAFQFRWDGVIGSNSFETTSNLVLAEVFGGAGCYLPLTIHPSSETSSTTSCDLVFYNYISPNGDGFNESWIIEHLGVWVFEKNKVSIMNRWGQEVWSGENYDNESVVWNGHDFKGNLLPDGTYYYIIESNESTYSGFIELQR